MQTLRHAAIRRPLSIFLIFSLIWLQIGPAWAGVARQSGAEREQTRWHALAMRRASGLPDGETQTLTPAQLRKVDSAQKAKARAPRPDVRVMTAAEMQRARGRGVYRNPYFNGTLPWQRSFHDVNICNGNLFKSFTDIQVAPARGAGLVLQRTYNSNDSRIGPFGVGWTHAYDIRMQEASDVKTESGNTNVPAGVNNVERTDFFGAKHTYHRDADGLYSPPNYMFDETSSDYQNVLANGPTKVMADTEKGLDGTIKHYASVVTLADGTSGNERACDYIQDRHGNTTNLAYAQSITQPDGSTRKLLTSVTDPSGRSLAFTWTNLNAADAQHPAWRITQVQGPLVGGSPVAGVSYKVTYEYFTDVNDPNAADDLYNLKAVHLDSDGLNRTTTYAYTHVSGDNGMGTNGTENSLLASVMDPLGHVVSYSYAILTTSNISGTFTYAAFWVTGISEPAGVSLQGVTRQNHWSLSPNLSGYINNGPGSVVASTMTVSVTSTSGIQFVTFYRNWISCNSFSTWQQAYQGNGGAYIEDWLEYGLDGDGSPGEIHDNWYDPSGNKVDSWNLTTCAASPSVTMREDWFAYGQVGNLLEHNTYPYTPQDSATYDNASQYFQKQSATDMNGHTSTINVGTSTDTNLGNRGSVLWVRDARYAVTGQQFSYLYNSYGQKTQETNENGTVTQYTYGDSFGNLTQVLQDPGSGTHLNRTTTMSYDAAGRVLSSTDPNGKTSTFTYNILGQPLTVATPATTGAPAETITYVYDTNGRTQTVTDNRGTTSINYETGCDRVHSVTDPVTGVMTYTYMLSGEKSSVSLPGSGIWTYAYLDPVYIASGNQTKVQECMPDDDPNHVGLMLQSITDDQGRIVNYNFNSDGAMSSVVSNYAYTTATPPQVQSSCTTSYSYDLTSAPNYYNHNWLSKLKTTFMSGTTPHILAENDYTYDNTGQRLTNTITDNNGVVRNEKYLKPDGSSGYDELNRLTNVDYGDGETQSYAFDPMGNRLTKTDTVGGATTTNTSTFDAANRLTAVDANAYTNDANGNTLTGGGRANVWDSQNRLVSCTSGGATTTYTYGADGLRRSATAAGVTTYYVYDGTMMVREMKMNASSVLVPSATYLTGPRGPEYRRDDNLGTVRWYVYDGLGSVVAEVDPSGNVTSTRKTDVYGVARGATGTATSKHGFVGSCGHLTDDTGLIYMRARYYDPALGRFASQDPKGSGKNWFTYGNDNPTTLLDPSGKDVVTIVHGIISADEDFLDGLLDAMEAGKAAVGEYLEETLLTEFSYIFGTEAAVAGASTLIVVSVEEELLGDLSTIMTDAVGSSYGSVEGIGALMEGAEAIEVIAGGIVLAEALE